MKKTLILVSDTTFPSINGVVRTLTETILQMQDRGWDVKTVFPTDHKTIACPGYSEIRLSLPPYRRLADAMWNGFTALHIATEGPLGLNARRTFVKHGLPFTSAFHTQFPAFLKASWHIPESLTYRWLRRFHAHSTAIMAPTKSIATLLETNGFKNVRVWGRGVDTDLFHRRSKLKAPKLAHAIGPIWLNVGRMSREKNLDAFLSLNLPGTKVIVGDGPDAKRLRSLYPGTIFLGSLHGNELAEIYNEADVFVFPSRSDTFGLVMAEAISSGVPVAAYDVAGPVDVVTHGVNGYLSGDLYDACIKAFVLKGTNVVGDFSWERATDQFESYLVKV